MFEVKLSRQASSSNSRDHKKLPSQSINPMEQCQAIAIRSRTINEPL